MTAQPTTAPAKPLPQRPRRRKLGRWTAILLGVVLAALGATYPIVDLTRAPLDATARADLLRDGRAQQFVTTSQGVMHVRVSGPGDGPVVLLVHGGAVGGYGFQHWQQPLAKAGYRVILPDLLGYGYSERPDVPYTREFYTTQLRDLLAALGINTKVHVIGASLGGTIATAFAARYPELVTSLVLIAPAGGGRTEVVKAPLRWPVIGDWTFRVFGPSTVRNMIASSYENTPARDEIVAWMNEQGHYRGFAEGILNTIRNYDSTWQPDTNQAVGRSGIPVLAVWGNQDRVNPYTQAGQLQRWMPQLRLVTLDGQGHAITYGQADTILAQAIPFLAETGPRRGQLRAMAKPRRQADNIFKSRRTAQRPAATRYDITRSRSVTSTPKPSANAADNARHRPRGRHCT